MCGAPVPLNQRELSWGPGERVLATSETKNWVLVRDWKWTNDPKKAEPGQWPAEGEKRTRDFLRGWWDAKCLIDSCHHLTWELLLVVYEDFQKHHHVTQMKVILRDNMFCTGPVQAQGLPRLGKQQGPLLSWPSSLCPVCFGLEDARGQ